MLDFFIILSLIAIVIGSFTDIKTLEVPDWLNYSLIAVGLGGNLIFSVYYWDYTYIMRSALGLAVSFALGMLMFYTGQWGGGDSKMLFGLGAMLGLSWPLKLEFYPTFLINLLFAGALYGLSWVITLAVIHRKNLSRKIIRLLHQRKLFKIRIVTGIISLVSLLAIIFLNIPLDIKVVLSMMIVLLYLLNYIFVAVKAVEEVAMIKLVDPSKLTEGDWIVEEIKVDGKRIAGPKDLGLEKKQLKEIMSLYSKGKIGKVKVKYGIPFVPSFLIAFVFTMITDKIVLLMFI